MNFRVFKAFAATFAYLAGHWPLLLKAMWLPALIITGLQLYAAPSLFNGLAELALLGPNPAPEAATAAFRTFGGSLIWYVVAGFIFFPMLTVASLRHIIRGEDLRAPFYLNYGADETRVMAANFLFNLMIVVISIVGELVVGVLAAAFLLFGAGAGAAARSIGALGVNAATAWFQLRMSTLFPAVIATQTLGFGEAWVSTRRGWLALAGYWILIGVVILPAIAVFLLPMILPVAGDLAGLGAGDASSMASLLQKLADSLDPKAAGFWVTAAAIFVMTLIVNAIVNVASAVAWRYLSSEGERA
jgi:hypothetical protein